MAVISMKTFLEAGVHFGHQTKRWHPNMATYIYGIKNGVHVMGAALLNGRVKIMDYATIGSGSIVFPDITISENVFVGACSMVNEDIAENSVVVGTCLLYTSPSPRDRTRSRMPSSA